MSAPQPAERWITPVLRPVRIAVGVPPNASHQQWIQFLGRSTVTWGGLHATMFFPSEEWEPGSLFDRAMGVFDPDAILLPAGSPQPRDALLSRYAPFEVEDHWPHQHGRWSVRRSTSLESALRLNLTESEAEKWDFAAGLHVEFTDLLGPPTELHLLVAAAQGYVPEELRPTVFRDVRRISTPMDLHVHRAAGMHAALALGGSGPAAYNAWGLTRLRSAVRWVESHATVVCGDTTSDIALWLTLRAIKDPATVFWLPGALVGDDTYRFLLLDRIRDISISATDAPIAYLTSTSLDEPGLNTLASAMTSDEPVGWTIDMGATMSLAERDFVSITRHEGRYLERIANDTHGQLRLRWPSELEAAPKLGVRFLAEVHVEGYCVPTHPLARPLVDGHPSGHRPGRYGVVVDPFPPFISATDQLSHIIGPQRLYLVDATTLAGRVSRAAGREATLSSAGRIMTEIVGRFGSLSEATVALCDPSWRVVSDALLSRHPETGKLQTRSLSRSLLSTSWMTAHFPDRLDAADEWLRRRLLVAGLSLQCPICRYLDFRTWDSLGPLDIACRRCRRDFAITPSTSKPWEPSFAMDELVYQGLSNNGLEEIALARWLVECHDTAIASLGLEWSPPNDSRGRSVETDVFAVCNGEAVIGEAKSSDSFDSPRQPRSLLDLATRLDARRLVFATSRPTWSAGAVTMIGSLARQYPGVSVEALVGLLQPDGPKRVALV